MPEVNDQLSRRSLLAGAAVASGAAASPRVLNLSLEAGPYSFPPAGKAYRENGESHRIWRSLLLEAPDLVRIRGGSDFGLSKALQPLGIQVWTSGNQPPAEPSAVRQDQDRRIARSPAALAGQLAGQYGQQLIDAVYTLSFSVWGRMRAGQVEPSRALLRDVPWPAKLSSSHYSGHLAYAALYEKTGDPWARDRVVQAALAARENPLHSEMSDSIFMVCPLLAKAGKLSGDASFYDSALRHFEFMRKLCLRPDGLYRHSPLCEAAWGRGNAFPLLGLALALRDIPASHSAYSPLRDAFHAHARQLVKRQTPLGTWRQVIDHPSAWQEFSCTAMIGWALHLSGGSYAGAVKKAWLAVNRRTGLDGSVMDVCESTGKQKSLEDYLNREAILGIDPRGGAMALMFATALAGPIA